MHMLLLTYVLNDESTTRHLQVSMSALNCLQHLMLDQLRVTTTNNNNNIKLRYNNCKYR